MEGTTATTRRAARAARPGPPARSGRSTPRAADRFVATAAALALAVVVGGGAVASARRTEADLQTRACAALAAAPGTLTGTVVFSGRDARLVIRPGTGVAAAAETGAALGDVRGTRTVLLEESATAPDGGCAGRQPAGGSGSAAQRSAPLVSVHFDTDSADLDGGDRARLDTVVAWLESHPAERLVVSGHTDDIGPDDRNRALSRARAQVVEAYLRDHDARAGTISVVGHGAFEPVAPNDSAATRAKNRRADVTIEGSR